MFTSQEIEFLAGEFSFQTGMDDAIAPSIVKHASLLIRGIDAETSAKLADYNWTMGYELSFVEPGTKQQKQYYVMAQMHAPQPGTLRLELERDGIWDVPHRA